ncbi:MAG: hypothetical protein Ta2E_08970 [Mycoplasmoidaceae bacterium]|nr:MAG: hypothetical protein Ta2E_08970 [Mycoplasmoidaceae bacterium]
MRRFNGRRLASINTFKSKICSLPVCWFGYRTIDKDDGENLKGQGRNREGNYEKEKRSFEEMWRN